MRAYVLTDARLARLAGRVVRLDIDTENPANAPFVEKFPIDAWPTLLAIDPATERPILRWAGTATVAQVEKLVHDAEGAMREGQASRADAALARADRLMGERRHAEAAAAYREALAAGGKGWGRRERAAEALVQASGFADDAAACARAAREVLPTLAPGAAAARVAAQGLACALDLEGAAARAAALDALEPLARKALAAQGVLADDRSWLYDELAQARAARGDGAGAKAIARRWLAFLDGEAGRATTPMARSAFDGQRLQAAIRAGEPARVLPALLASERDLPDDYVPPTNLGVLYLALGRPEDAIAAADRALAKAKGPRRIRVLVLEAQAQDAAGERAAARATLERALAESAALPEATRPKGYTAKARSLLASMGGGDGAQ
jgi:tetratricopeptide (TPR) repeat protein